MLPAPGQTDGQQASFVHMAVVPTLAQPTAAQVTKLREQGIVAQVHASAYN